MKEREELRALGAAALYDMELAGREQGAEDRLLVHDPERAKVDDTFALSRDEAVFEFLAKSAIRL